MGPLDWFRVGKPAPAPRYPATRVSSGRPIEVIRVGKNGKVKK